jgi:hypothetical protein
MTSSSGVCGTLRAGGALSKANQAMTSDLLPNSDPLNMDHLRSKHPEPAHPNRDPVCVSSILWTRPDSLQEYWSSDAGTEFLDKWFSIPKISQYVRTHSLVTMVDIDGWHARDIITPLFFNDNMEQHNLMRKRLILPYLTGSFHPSLIEEYAGYRNKMLLFAPSCAGRSGVAASPVSQPVRDEVA